MISISRNGNGSQSASGSRRRRRTRAVQTADPAVFTSGATADSRAIGCDRGSYRDWTRADPVIRLTERTQHRVPRCAEVVCMLDDRITLRSVDRVCDRAPCRRRVTRSSAFTKMLCFSARLKILHLSIAVWKKNKQKTNESSLVNHCCCVDWTLVDDSVHWTHHIEHVWLNSWRSWEKKIHRNACHVDRTFDLWNKNFSTNGKYV